MPSCVASSARGGRSSAAMTEDPEGRAERRSINPWRSANGPQVAVEPVERLADEIRSRNVVPGVVDDAAFLVGWSAEQVEHRDLGCRFRQKEVEMAVQHQRRHL